jgi:hypothetical protein
MVISREGFRPVAGAEVRESAAESGISSIRVISGPDLSDQGSVSHQPSDVAPGLRLIARSAQEPDRMVRFLTGVIAVCGGRMLSRRFHSDGSAGLECEFVRAHCVEMYAALVAAGLELSRSSHLKMAELCQCTYALPESCELQTVALELEVQRLDEESGALRSAPWRRRSV